MLSKLGAHSSQLICSSCQSVNRPKFSTIRLRVGLNLAHPPETDGHLWKLFSNLSCLFIRDVTVMFHKITGSKKFTSGVLWVVNVYHDLFQSILGQISNSGEKEQSAKQNCDKNWFSSRKLTRFGYICHTRTCSRKQHKKAHNSQVNDYKQHAGPSTTAQNSLPSS